MQYFGPALMASKSPTSRPGSRYGSGLISAASTNAKIARFAPIPSARTRIAVKRKCRTAPELPKRKAQILQHGLHTEAHNLVTLFLQSSCIPELPPRRIASRLRSHAVVEECLLRRRAMELHLLVQVVVKTIAAKQQPQLAIEMAYRHHRRPHARSSTRPMAAIIWSNSESSTPSCLRPAAVSV